MKKSLLALAVFGAFAGAASAQSSVTLYGIVDVDYQYTDFKRDGASSINGINGGHQAGSRLGFRGSEALGGGLNAVFTLEAGYNPDLGTSGQGGRLFGRQIWAGLQGNFGTLVLGRIPTFSSGTGSFDMIGDMDPFITGYGIAGFQSSAQSVNATRNDNSIMYRTPNFAGFQAGLGYSFNIDSTVACPGTTVQVAGECQGDGNNRRMMFSGIRYAAGPIAAAITYDIIAQPIAGQSDQKHLQVGASWDFKFLRLMGIFAKEDNINYRGTPIVLPATITTPGSGGVDGEAWVVGLTAPIGPGLVRASYQERDGDATATIAERDGKGWALGYVYNVSKRTDIYLTYADYKGEKSISEGSLPTALPGGSDLFNLTQITLGVNHRF
jgi:general bacterial porin, GBP family